MPNRNNHWITQRENGWADIREGNQRATKIYDTQLEAFCAAREIARQEGGEVIINCTDLSLIWLSERLSPNMILCSVITKSFLT